MIEWVGGMAVDKVDALAGAVIQHGPENRRIFVMDWQVNPDAQAAAVFRKEAQRLGYTKVIAKVSESFGQGFLDEGYVIEAVIPGFFQGVEDAWLLSCFLDPARERMPLDTELRIKDVLATAQAKEVEPPSSLGASYRWIRCSNDMSGAMAAVYSEVFATYPFPITEPAYIEATMNEKSVWYYAVMDLEDEIAALAAAEFNPRAMAVEMTDFATVPKHRGQGLAQFLLRQMEGDVAHQGVKTAFTIARAVSYGMNRTFHRLGYQFGGTLVNNTNIAGQLESMNIWYKPLDTPGESCDCSGI